MPKTVRRKPKRVLVVWIAAWTLFGAFHLAYATDDFACYAVRNAAGTPRFAGRTGIARAFDPSRPVVVIDATTLARHLVWAEIDSNPRRPSYDIPGIPAFPFAGSAIVVWDSGTPTPPIENVPPFSPQYGSDPHGKPRANASARLQKSEFLKAAGAVVDTCGGLPCLAP